MLAHLMPKYGGLDTMEIHTTTPTLRVRICTIATILCKESVLELDWKSSLHPYGFNSGVGSCKTVTWVLANKQGFAPNEPGAERVMVDKRTPEAMYPIFEATIRANSKANIRPNKNLTPQLLVVDFRQLIGTVASLVPLQRVTFHMTWSNVGNTTSFFVHCQSNVLWLPHRDLAFWLDV